MMLQTNDITQSVAVSTFSTQMGNIVSHELAVSPAPSVMLAVPPVDSGTGSFPASSYTAAQQALYVADAIDLYNIQWQWGTAFNSASGLWSSDNIHPNDKGALSEYAQIRSKFVDNLPAQALTIPSQYKTQSCQSGIGDGTNAIVSGPYPQTPCKNVTGVTWTINSIQCFTDNNGTSTMDVKNHAGTSFLTAPITCSNSFAAGTQSATTTLANGDTFNFTFTADGSSKQVTFLVGWTY